MANTLWLLTSIVCLLQKLGESRGTLVVAFDQQDHGGKPAAIRCHMQQFGITQASIQQRHCNSALQAPIDFQIQRIKSMTLTGAPLGRKVTGCFGLQLRFMLNDGWRVLQLLDLHKENCVFRPCLNNRDWLALAWSALWKSDIECQGVGRFSHAQFKCQLFYV